MAICLTKLVKSHKNNKMTTHNQAFNLIANSHFFLCIRCAHYIYSTTLGFCLPLRRKVLMRVAFFILSFLLLNGCSRYEVRDNSVYWTYWKEGMGSGEIELDADHETFKILEHDRYAKDKFRVFYQGSEVKGADAKSFKSVWEFYGIDRNHAYYGEKLIPNAIGSSFEVIDGNFSRDGKDYFYSDKALNVCDYESFVIHDFNGAYGNWLSYDDQCAYFQKSRIPLVDRASFEILIGGYTKDKANVYYGSRIVEGADPESFEMIGNTFAGKDKHSCFNGFDRVDCL